MGLNKIENKKNKWFLQTEVLPGEIPILFSNDPISKKIDLIMEEYFYNLEKNFGQNYTVPLSFYIPKKNNSNRKISLVHPLSQLEMLIFTKKYDHMITNFTSKSLYSARTPLKLNKATIKRKEALRLEMKKVEEEYGLVTEVNTTNEEIDYYYNSYYSYNIGKRLNYLLKSSQFKRDKNSYKYFMKLDIQNCFPSIYTHSLTWAILGNKELGKSMTGTQYNGLFSNATDIISQKCNNNETHGIVVGPEFSRIIAELLLTRVDIELQNKLLSLQLKHHIDYTIYRYIDDFYIFSNDFNLLDTIQDYLEINLRKYNLVLNTSKKEIQTSPFRLYEEVIIDLRTIMDNHSRKRFEIWLHLKEKNLSSELNSYEILGNQNSWEVMYESLERLARDNPLSKRRLVLFFLKSIKIEIPTTLSSKMSKDYKIILKIIEVISNVFSFHIDNDTTNAYLILMTKINNSLNSIKNSINETTIETVKSIQEKIFNEGYRLINNNINRFDNMYDILVYLKFFEKKLSSQLLCEILSKYCNSYFVVCSIAYYIKKKDSIEKDYQVVLKKLKVILDNYILDYDAMGLKNRIFDAQYFYFINDFSHYKPIGDSAFNYKKQINKDLKNLSNDLIPIFTKITESSYYSWDTNKTSFEKRLIKKIILNKDSTFWNNSDY